MKLEHYENHWRGIRFRDISSFSGDRNAIAGPQFYSDFYTLLASKADTEENQNWIRGKKHFSKEVLEKVINPWKDQYGRSPKILSVGVGEGIIEEEWLKLNLDVTLQECQEFSLQAFKNRYPYAKMVIGDIRDLNFSDTYDLICLLTVDYCLTDHELLEVFQKMRMLLSDQGRLINYTANSISYRRWMIWSIKRYCLRTYHDGTYMKWGWYRSPGLINAIARLAQWKLDNQFYSKAGKYYKRLKMLSDFLPFTSESLLSIYQKNG